MAFKTVEQYNGEKYNGKFVLQNDKDVADVIFLYRSTKDVLVADTHYIKSADYSGYVHCNGRGCPACANNIRVQTKLFIPLYVLSINGNPVNEIQFWDRTSRFEPQLQSDVFSKFPNPSEFVWRITRQGVSGDVNTRYQIIPAANNNVMFYDEILMAASAKMPDYYENICRDVDTVTIASWINSSGNFGGNGSDMPNYVPTPRVSSAASAKPIELPDSDVYDEEIDEEVDFN